MKYPSARGAVRKMMRDSRKYAESIIRENSARLSDQEKELRAYERGIEKERKQAERERLKQIRLAEIARKQAERERLNRLKEEEKVRKQAERERLKQIRLAEIARKQAERIRKQIERSNTGKKSLKEIELEKKKQAERERLLLC